MGPKIGYKAHDLTEICILYLIFNVFHVPNYRYEPKYVQYLMVNFTFNLLQGLNLMFKQCHVNFSI